MVKITPEVKKIIEENPVALATVDGKCKPNVNVVSFAKIVAQDKVLITDNYMKQTRENLASSSDVCLAVWDKDWNGYKLVGQAKYFKEGEWKKFVEEMPENKDFPAK
ncbi:MAG: hypothetical protein A2Y57_00960, partial [Candidatus Woykebacteria bacterium RBG_13_40_7b]